MFEGSWRDMHTGNREVSEDQTGAMREFMPDTILLPRLRKLMRDKAFLIAAAERCDASYKEQAAAEAKKNKSSIPSWAQGPLFADNEKEILLKDRDSQTAEEQGAYKDAMNKLSMNIAGFYAIQEGMGLLQHLYGDRNPHVAYDVIKALARGSVLTYESSGVPGDYYHMRAVFSRLAHATWAAGQPFRDRETRPVMMPFDELPTGEREKDWVQICAAAEVLLEHLNK